MTHYPPRLLERVSAPASEPLSLSETKLYLRVDGTDEDTLITSLIAIARDHAEQYTRRSLISQGWKLAYDDAAPAHTPLPRSPIISLDGVSLIDINDNTTSFSTGNYHLNAAEDAVTFIVNPIAHRVEISYTAGYGSNATDVPAAIRHAMLAHIAAMYEHRGEGSELLPSTSKALLEPYRIMGV